MIGLFTFLYLCALNVMMSSFQGCPLVTVVRCQTLTTWQYNSTMSRHFTSLYLCTLNVMTSSFQGCPVVTLVLWPMPTTQAHICMKIRSFTFVMTASSSRGAMPSWCAMGIAGGRASVLSVKVSSFNLLLF